MKIRVITVGRFKKGPEAELCRRYADRVKAAARPLGFSSFDSIELVESKALSAEKRKADEAAAILSKAGQGQRLLVLDERGENVTSRAFAALLSNARDNAQDVTLVIGGADGLSEALRESPGVKTLSFGRATWPHQLVRIMLFEQIYRALTILSGHPYHRD